MRSTAQLRAVDGDPGVVDVAPGPRIAAFVAAVGRALQDEAVAFRVGQAGVLVRVDFVDHPVQPVFLAFDDTPPTASTAPVARRPDVVLTMTTADLEGCMRPGGELPLRILSGEIRFEGYVRKLLRVLPVLHAALQDDAGC